MTKLIARLRRTTRRLGSRRMGANWLDEAYTFIARVYLLKYRDMPELLSYSGRFQRGLDLQARPTSGQEL